MKKRRVMKKDNIRNVEYSLLCKLFRRKLKDDLEGYKGLGLVTAAEWK